MNRTQSFAGVSVVLLSLAGLLNEPALAFECDNIGTAGVPSEDSGVDTATACGPSSLTDSVASTAFGYDSSSTAFEGTAIGFGTRSIGASSTAVGAGAVSGGPSSAALGDLARSDGNQSIALGANASSAGDYSTAVGASAGADGDWAIAIGNLTVANGSSSLAIGDAAIAEGYQSDAVGYLAWSIGDKSTALGHRAYADQPNTIVLGSIPGINERYPEGPNEYADVAIGTTNPLAPLHVHRDNGTAEIMVEETSLDVAPRTLFTLANPGNTKFEIMNTDAMNSWAFTNSGGDFRISLQDSGIVEFRVDNFGNAYVANDLNVGGTIVTNLNMPSDVGLKKNIAAFDSNDVLEKLVALPISAWEYKDKPGQQHIGPMAQDFHAAFGLGDRDTAISVVDASGVALASIQALNQKLERRNAELESKNQELGQRLAQLEAVVGQLLPKVAQN